MAEGGGGVALMRTDTRVRKYDWKSFLTSAEAVEIAEIEKETTVIDRRRKELADGRRRLIQRAISRIRIGWRQRA